MNIDMLEALYHYANTTEWFPALMATLSSADSQQVRASVAEKNIGPSLRAILAYGWDGTLQGIHFDLSLLQGDHFADMFGLYLFLVVLGQPESKLDGPLRSTFAELPNDKRIAFLTRAGEMIKQREAERAAASREEERIAALLEAERAAAMREEERMAALRAARATYCDALIAVIADSTERGTSADALLAEQFEASAKRLSQEFIAFAISKMAKTLSPTERPRLKCTFISDTKTLHLDVQIPIIEHIGGPVPAREITAARRSVVAFICVNVLRNLVVENIGTVIRQIYLDAYVVKASRLSGDLKRRYALSVCLNDDNADILFNDALDPSDSILRMGGRMAREPGEDAIERIRGLEPMTNSADAAAQKKPLELTPAEFETLVASLFRSLGFSVEQTSGSWDGGVDCIATDPRPLVGGKILIQAKRFSGTVDVSVVRDLYGLVLSQGASKGVIVTTGNFGPTSREFVLGKPIELIDGTQLARFLETLLPERGA